MESIKDSMGMAKALYKLGTLFYYQESYQQALSFYKRSLAICEQLKESEKSSFHCLGGIGTAFSSLGKQEEALEYHYKALSIARKYNLRKGEAYTLHNIGAVHLISKEYETALNYFTKSLMIKKELKDSWGEVGSYQYLGDLYLATGQFGMAISYFEKGLSLSKKIESDTRLKDLYRLLAKAHHLKGNHDQSYHYFNKFSALRDSMYNAELLEKMTNMQERYEIQRRVSEIKSLKNENHILEQEKVIQQLNRRYLVFGFICLFLLTLALFLLYKNIIQNKWNKQLAVKNEEIQYKNKRLEFKNEELRKFAFIASHDLKAPLRTIGSFTGLLRRRYGKMFDETADEYMGFIIEATKRMYQLLDDLLKYSNLDKLAEGTVDQGMDLEKWLDTREVIDVALSNLAYHIKKEEADIEILSGEFPSIRANPSHMVQVFQNIIANGIKFKGEEKPKIHIDCATNGSQHIFSIKDNGIGIAPEFKDKIFDMFSRLHLLGKYEGTGIGLATCKRIINRLGGKIWVESEEGKGSTFFFTVPRIAK